MLFLSVVGDEVEIWNFDNVDIALPTLFASLLVRDEERILGVDGEDRDEVVGVVGSLLWRAVAFWPFPLFRFLDA